jgi:DNA-binding NarL/FixJ family response regulator
VGFRFSNADGLNFQPSQGGLMSDGLDVIIVDADPNVCEHLSEIINRFYTWGNVFVFTSVDEAAEYCQLRNSGIAIFVVDVFLGEKTGFMFLDMIAPKYRSAAEDTVMITGNASDDVVNTCVATGVNHLLEKPIRPFALQLAIRAIIAKYLNFTKKLLEDSSFLQQCSQLLK